MIDRSDVQGNVLLPYDYPAAAHVFLAVETAASARRWLSSFLPSVTTAEPWRSGKPATTANLAVSAAGLAALGVRPDVVASFPPAFRAGLATRSGVLSDPDPAGWEFANPHLLVQLHARRQPALDEALEGLLASLVGLRPVLVQPAHRMSHRREHFGFVDGLAQPAIAGGPTGPPAVGNPGRLGRTRSLPTGELLHGYPDLDSRQPAAPDAPFRRNGTFMVWRKLEQDVVAFRRWLVDQARATGIDAEEVAAKAMGRWRDGTPAVRSPDRPLPALAADEAFRFKEDARGLACPLGAHIRRANPRDSLGFGAALTGRHRMVRRGMPYGSHLPPDSPDDGQSRGLLFVALVADIERQYEFVQVQWLNGGNLFGLGDDRDPIAGQGDGTGKMTVPGHPPRFLHPLPALVTMRGGEYLYVPSINGLRHLAGGAL